MAPLWYYLVPALALLCTPLRVLLRHRIRSHDYESLAQKRMKPLRDLKRQPWLWADVLRGYAGGWALRNGWVHVEGQERFWNHSSWVFALCVVVFALMLQTWPRRPGGVMFAPVSFCAGLVGGLMPTGLTIIILVFAVASLVAFRAWWAFFVCGAVGSLGFGYLILRMSPWVLVCMMVFAFPAFSSWSSHRALRLPLNRIRVRHRGTSMSAEEEAADAIEDADEN